MKKLEVFVEITSTITEDDRIATNRYPIDKSAVHSWMVKHCSDQGSHEAIAGIIVYDSFAANVEHMSDSAANLRQRDTYPIYARQ